MKQHNRKFHSGVTLFFFVDAFVTLAKIMHPNIEFTFACSILNFKYLSRVHHLLEFRNVRSMSAAIRFPEEPGSFAYDF